MEGRPGGGVHFISSPGHKPAMARTGGGEGVAGLSSIVAVNLKIRAVSDATLVKRTKLSQACIQMRT